MLAVTKIKKRHFLAHLILFFNVQRGISNKCHKLVITWGYKHEILVVEVKNSAKVTLLSFNVTAVFSYDAMVSENDVLEAGSAVDVFAWLTYSSDCKFELQVVNQSKPVSSRVSNKSPLFKGILTFAVIEKVISTKTALKRCCSHFDEFGVVW